MTRSGNRELQVLRRVFVRVLSSLGVLAAIFAARCFAPSHAVPDNQLQQQFATAQSLFDKKKHAEAQRILLDICKNPHATAEMRVLLADTFLDTSGVDEEGTSLKEAEEGLKIAAKQAPDWGRPYKDMAEFCNLREQYTQAIALATTALEKKRPDIFALRQRAIAYSHVGKNKEALEDITKFIASGQKTLLNFQLRAEFEKSLKNYSAAADDYLYVLQRSQSNRLILIHSWVDCMQAQKKYKDAVEGLSIEIKNDPTRPDPYELRGDMQLLAGNPKAALADLTKAISINPAGRFYKKRAAIYKALGQNGPAEDDLKKSTMKNAELDMKDMLKF